KRLRQAHALTVDEVASALKVRRATVTSWEAGRTEPRPPERDAYARLLDGLAQLYPAPTNKPGPDENPAAGAVPAPAETAPVSPVPETFTGAPAPAQARVTVTEKPSEAAVTTAPEPTARPAARTSSTSRRPGAKKAAPAGTPASGADPRFENGPLAVVDVEDGKVLAYCTGGLVLDVPAKSIP
ncbi:helix-turn-helix domain-containing protein, partial [Streptomyces sp. SID5770]|uniref:helix-turn-helix transcriptional regulator n=1 Tax=Streptomyces sp. SID5770 TaxID=2690308 RepID=UPI0013702976